MNIYILISSLILIAAGLVLAFGGYKLIKSLARIFAGILFGAVMFSFGIWLGNILDFWPLPVGILSGGVGLVLGLILGPSLLFLIITALAVIAAWSFGMTLGKELGMGTVPIIVLALVVSVIVGIVVSAMLKRIIISATAVAGGIISGVGAFILMTSFSTLWMALAISLFITVAVGIVGLLYQSKKKRKRSSKSGKKKS